MFNPTGAISVDLYDLKRSVFRDAQIVPERLLIEFENLRDLGPAELSDLIETDKHALSMYSLFKYEIRALSLAILDFKLNPTLECFARRMKYWKDFLPGRLKGLESDMSACIKDICMKFDELEKPQSQGYNPSIATAALEVQDSSREFAPYISIVVTSRNDNHGGDLTKRTKLFLDTLAVQVKTYAFDVELILVDWNPPDNAKTLLDELDLTSIASSLRVHLVSVPPSIHQAISCGSNYPLYQMIAKNVGIKRAAGEFVLCTNVDILFSNELISFLASKPLSSGVIYRAERWDVRRTVYDVPRFEPSSLIQEVENHAYRANIVNGFKDLIGDNHEIWDVDQSSPDGFLGNIFTNACGDFQLMSRSDWEVLRGYPEWNVYSMHLDSVLQYKALSKGMSEVVLPSAMRVYHVDHSDGWSLESERSGVFEASVKKKLGIQKLTFDELRLLGYAYFVLRGDTNENSPNWGLRDVEARSTLKSGYPSIRCTELIWSKSFDSEHNFFTPHKTKSRINESELGWKSAVNIAIDYLHRTLPRGRPILIWGAGERGVFCLRRLREIGRGDQVVGFLDGDQRKWGHCIDRLRIFGPEKLTDANHAYIKIACHLQSEIEQALRTKGLDAFVDYL